MSSALLYNNVADDGLITASSWIAASPPATLKNPHVMRRWKGTQGASEYILCTWDVAQSIDTIALFGAAVIIGGIESTMSESATQRVRVSSVDTTGLSGDLYDSGVVTGGIRSDFGSLIILLQAPVSARAVLIDISQGGADALMVGRLVVGLRSSFSLNFGFGWSYGYADLSRRRKSVGGQTFVDRDDRYRVLDLTYESLSAADRYAHVQEADRLNGISRDILFMTDTDSAKLDRDSIWGLMQETSPPTQPNIAYFSKTYRIEERR